MPRIKITWAHEHNSVRVSNGAQHVDVPIDGNFHEIHDDLIGPLNDSAVQFEIENADAPGGNAAAAGAAGLGGSAAPAKRRAAKGKSAKAAKRK